MSSILKDWNPEPPMTANSTPAYEVYFRASDWDRRNHFRVMAAHMGKERQYHIMLNDGLEFIVSDTGLDALVALLTAVRDAERGKTG